MKKLKALKKRIFSSSVSVILAAAIILSTFSGMFILAGVLPSIWSGETATAFAKGSGTETDPFIVSNGEELALAVSSTGRDREGNQYYYSMSSDIFLNDVTNAAWKDDASNHEWAFVQKDATSASKAFSGVFYGNGYKVYGLYIKESFAAPSDNKPDESYAAGLFPTATKGAVISGVGLEDSYIALTNNHATSGYSRTGNVGAIIGYVYADFDAPVKLDRCYSSESVHLTGAFCGLVGGISNSRKSSGETALRMDSCYGISTATVFFDWSDWAGNRFMMLSSLNSNNLTANYCYTTGGYGFYDLISETGASNYTPNWIPNTTVFTKVSADAMKGDGALSATGMALLGDSGSYVTTATYPVLKIFADREAVSDKDIWDGSKVAPSKGTGTEADPWLIETPEELAYVVYNKGGNGKFYKLVNDIYLNDITKIDWSTGAVAPGYTVNTWVGSRDGFNGTIDGDGHTVYGMYYKSTSTKAWGYNGVGLVGKILSGEVTIKRLGVDNAYLEHKNAASAFVGWLQNGTAANIDMCFAGENVTLKAWETGAFIGQGNGGDFRFHISNSFSRASMTSSHRYGLHGEFYGGGLKESSVSNCFNANGPIYSATTSATVANCYATAGSVGTVVTAANMQGEDALTNANKMPALGNKFLATQGYPEINFEGKVIIPTPDYVWDGTTAEPTEGDGSEEAPYIIKTAEEFVYVMRSGGKGKHYKLANSIYLNDVNKVNWETGEGIDGYSPRSWGSVPENWNGTVDGAGFTVYGLYSKGGNSFSWGWSGTGLIPKLKGDSANVTFKNLGLDNCYMVHENAAGGFVGYHEKGNLTLNKCFVGQNAYFKGYSAGTLFGMAPGGVYNVTNCYSLGTSERGADKADSLYGLHGQVYGGNAASTLSNCYNANGPVTTGGEAGTFKNNYATSGTKGTILTKDNMQGADALTNPNKMPKLGRFFKATATYPVIDFDAVEDTTPDYVWDGSAVAPTKGSGTLADPYLIENAENLAAVIKSGGKKGASYKLTADIYINDIEKIDWATGEIADDYTVRKWGVGWPDTFSGIIDGDGHVVYGLYYRSDSTMAWGYNGAGLIGKLVSGDVVLIKNLGVDCAYVRHHNAASAFIGYDNSGATASIDKCYVGGMVTLAGYETGAFIGQAPGGSFSLTNCYSLATLVKGPGDDSAYGLYGQAYGEGSTNSSVMHCFNGNGPIGGKVGAMKNNYATVEGGGATVLTADNMKGTDVFDNIAKMSVLNRTKAFVATDSFPILKVFSSDPSTGGGAQGDIWDGLVINAFAQGSGTKTDPYIISNGSELAFAVGTRSGLYFKLAKDIYLNDVSSNGWYLGNDLNEWFTGKSFSGHIDGDGHCVYGIWFPSGNNYKYAGLLPQMSSGSVKNLGIRYSYITAKNFAAGFTAYIEGWSGNEVTFENCFVDDTVRIGFTGTETWNDASYGAGGFVAYLYGYDKEAAAANEKVARTVSFNNCYSKATIEGTSTNRMNGMIGTIWLSNYSIKNCYSIGYPVVHATGSTMAFDIHNHQTGIDATDYSDVFKNNYSDVGNDSMSKVYTIIPAIADWHGEKAKKSLKGFNFDAVWETVGKGSPKLRVFKDISGEDISMPDPTGTFASGKGTKNDPYIIKTAKHLRNMVEMKITAGKYFVIANDIYVNDTTNKNWKKNAVKWVDGKDLPIFGGHLDGGGHKVYGLYVTNTAQTGSDLSTSATGLIPRAGIGASVKNVHVRDSYISGVGYAGAIIGYTNGNNKGNYISVIGCSADETVSVQGQTAGGIIGGGPTGIRLYYCYFTGKLTATSEGRGNALMGDIWNNDCQVVECYSAGYESYRNSPQNIVNVYGTEEDTKVTVLTKAQMTGANAKKNMDLSFDTYWYVAGGKTPQLKVVDENNLGYTFKDEGKKGQVWTGKIATKFAGGSGTEEDPYLIETPEQLAYMFYRGAGSYSYKLIADLKLNDTSKADWEKTANTWFSGRNYGFSGHFDGNGHVITGLYAESTDAIVALFPYVYYNAIIENLGIDDSSIINPSSDGYKQSYSGALVGYIESWQEETANNYKHPPIIRKCFVGDGVYVEGFFAGGLVAGCAKSAVFEDCYVTCELTGSSMSGAFIATAWNSDIPIKVTNCYAATVNSDNFISNGAAKNAVYTNVYHDGTRGGAADTMNILSMFFMQGTKAKEYLKGFDFNKVWRLVEGGTPVLRVFGNAAQYSCTREPNKVDISFATNGGDPLDPLSGFGYTDIEQEIPTPVRYGYRFLGWYYTPNFAVEFDLTQYPPTDMILYAKWEEVGFEYGFEGDLDTEYDILGNMEHFRPGVMGYNPKNVKAGLKALHILAENETDPIFLVNYRYPLEVGKEYEVTFWVSTTTEDTVSVDFLYAEHPQANSPVIGYEKIVEEAGGAPGVWKQYKATITAAAPYLLVRTSKGVDCYYDEFQMVPNDKDGDLSNVITFAPEDIQTEPGQNTESGGNNLWLILSIVGGVILLAAVATVSVIFIKKRKKA